MQFFGNLNIKAKLKLTAQQLVLQASVSRIFNFREVLIAPDLLHV